MASYKTLLAERNNEADQRAKDFITQLDVNPLTINPPTLWAWLSAAIFFSAKPTNGSRHLNLDLGQVQNLRNQILPFYSH